MATSWDSEKLELQRLLEKSEECSIQRIQKKTHPPSPLLFNVTDRLPIHDSVIAVEKVYVVGPFLWQAFARREPP